MDGRDAPGTVLHFRILRPNLNKLPVRNKSPLRDAMCQEIVKLSSEFERIEVDQ